MSQSHLPSVTNSTKSDGLEATSSGEEHDSVNVNAEEDPSASPDTTYSAQASAPVGDSTHDDTAASVNAAAANSANPDAADVAGSPSPLTDSGSSEKDSDKDAKKKKNRCAVCRKKVGLTGFECRCGGLFCALHRYSDKHDCSFNYREMGAQEIRRNNPVVVGEKIQKI